MSVLLAELTTFHVGGAVKRYLRTADRDELIAAIREADGTTEELAAAATNGEIAPREPLLFLGGGSNILASDRGFDGLVLSDARQDIAVLNQTGGTQRTSTRERGCADNQGTIGAPATIHSAENYPAASCMDPMDLECVIIRATAGVPWDKLVEYTIAAGWSGLEALSGIPGTVGAAPVQNIGAYGAEVAETLYRVRALDRLTGLECTLTRAELALTYRSSNLKRSMRDPKIGGGCRWTPTGRWIVLEAEFQLGREELSQPVRYQQLADTLSVQLGERVPTRRVREAVLELRRSKGMVVDPTDQDTWSAGSFFTNPIVSQEVAASLPPDAPRFPVEARVEAAGSPSSSSPSSLLTDSTGLRGDALGNSRNAEQNQPQDSAPSPTGLVKTSAAWLISHAGFAKGFRVDPQAPAALSHKHVLALTNQGGATAKDVLELAETVQRGVRQKFGIDLTPEPIIL